GSAFTAEAARRFGLSPSNYDGPTGMTGVLQDACVRAGVPTVSLWGAVPHYFAQSPSPKVMLALLRALQDVTGVAMPVGDLPTRAAEWERTIDELTAADEDIADYIRSLEERGDDDTAAAVDAMDGAELAEEFERFLRRRGDDGPGDGAPGPDRSDEPPPEEGVDRVRDPPRRRLIGAQAGLGVGDPRIDRGQRACGVQIVRQVLAQAGQRGLGRRTLRAGHRGPPALQPGARGVQQIVRPGPIGA